MAAVAALLLILGIVVAGQQLRGAGRDRPDVTVERLCGGLGVPPRESHQYGFYLGLALARAAEVGRVHCVEAILALQDPPVDAGTPDSAGLTALAHSAKRGEEEPFRLLLPRSDVRCAAWGCRAPLCLASAEGHATLAEALLDAGSHVDGTNLEGRTPLQLASLAGHLSVVSCLLPHRADVTCSADDDGRTALHRAASRGHAEVVAALLAAGARPLVFDIWNQTARDLAEQQGHSRLANVLDLAASIHQRPRQDTDEHEAHAGDGELEQERRKLEILEERRRLREEA